MVGRLIALCFTVRRHSPSRKRVGGAVLGVLAAVTTWVATAFATPPARADVLGLLLVFWAVGWLVGPVLTSATPPVRPEHLALLPLDRRRVGVGLFATAFVGVGAAVTLPASFAPLLLAGASPTALGVGALAAVLFVVLVVAVSRIGTALVGTAMRTRAGVELAGIQYGLLLASLFAGWLMVAPVVRAVPTLLAEGAGPTISPVLAVLPTTLPVAAVAAAARGDVDGALLDLSGLGALAAVAVGIAVVLLAPRVGGTTGRRRIRPLGGLLVRPLRHLPTGPTAAVVGKELRSWWRDAWRGLEIRSAVWFGVFVALFGIAAGHPAVAGLGGVAVALTIALSGANLYGQDGTALWQLVVAQSPAATRADVRGRQIGLVVALGGPAVLVAVAGMALTGETTYAAPVLAVLLAVAGVGCGVALVVSILGVAPGVDPHHRVDATDVGENGFMIPVANWTTLLLVVPTLAVCATPVLAGRAPTPVEGVVALAVGLLNGVGGAVLIGRWAVTLLERRLVETFHRVRWARA